MANDEVSEGTTFFLRESFRFTVRSRPTSLIPLALPLLCRALGLCIAQLLLKFGDNCNVSAWPTTKLVKAPQQVLGQLMVLLFLLLKLLLLLTFLLLPRVLLQPLLQTVVLLIGAVTPSGVGSRTRGAHTPGFFNFFFSFSRLSSSPPPISSYRV